MSDTPFWEKPGFDEVVEEARASVPAVDYSAVVPGRSIWMNHASSGCNKHRMPNLWNPPKGGGDVGGGE